MEDSGSITAHSGENAGVALGRGFLWRARSLLATTALSMCFAPSAGAQTLTGDVIGSGSQIYNTAITLGADVTLASTDNGYITFDSTINGAYGLTINTGGLTWLGGAIGGTTALTSLTTDAGGITAIFGNVTTTGAQTYNDAVGIGPDVILTSLAGGDITFGNTVGIDSRLAVSTQGSARFDGEISGLGGIAQAGTGTLTLSTANSYSGGTVLQAGSIHLGTSTSLGTGILNVTGNASLFSAGAALDIANAIDLAAGANLVTGGASDLNLGGHVTGNGALTKTGSGTLTLTGDNSFTGGTKIEDGRLRVTSDGALGTGSVLVDASAWGAELNYNGASAGSNSITIQAGNLNFTNGASAGSATINNNTGYDSIRFLDTSDAKNATIYNAGGIYFVDSSDARNVVIYNDPHGFLMFTNSATAGSARVFNQGASEILFRANATAGGATIVNEAGSFIDLSPHNGGLVIGSLSGAGDVFLGGRDLTVGALDNNDEISGIIQDGGRDGGTGGSFAKTGIGTLTLKGVNTYTGTTTVSGGTLAVNGSIASSSLTTVGAGAKLKGIGTVGSTTVASGGRLAPGNSIGTLTVAGNLLLHPGSIYEVEIAAAGQSDRIDVVGGTATVTGAHVDVMRLDPDTSYQDGQTYRILNADGGVTGQFAEVASQSAFLDFDLDHNTDSVDLRISLKTIEPGPGPNPDPDPLFGSVAETPNQIATAGGLDELRQSGPQLALYNALLMLDAGQARAAFDQLSGEIHAAARGVLLDDSRFLRDAVTDRLRAAFEGVGAATLPVMAYGENGPQLAPAGTERLAAWGNAFGSWGKADDDGNAAGLDHDTGGLLMGVDGLVFETWRLGIVAGYSHSNFHVDDRASSGSSDNYHLGAYAGTSWGKLGFRSGLAYTWHDVETARTAAFPGFADRLSADYDAGSFQAFGELGYRIDTQAVSFEPFASLAYVNLRTAAFSEDGGAAALHGASQTTDATFTTLGIRAQADVALGAVPATARAMLGWRHAFGDVTSEAGLAFAGGEAFTIAGTPIARNAAVIEAGLDIAVAPSATLGLSYRGQFASRTSDNGFKVDLNVRF